ncbi:hypothetical protein GGI23_005093 [Coemansia sp. RSA 2559]|nr:hypothetical protein GGI23_005093 [Coemansia sp. RSA 2559]
MAEEEVGVAVSAPIPATSATCAMKRTTATTEILVAAHLLCITTRAHTENRATTRTSIGVGKVAPKVVLATLAEATMTGMLLMSAIAMSLIPRSPVVPEAIIAWVSALNTDPAAEVVLRPEAEAEAEEEEEEEDHMAKEAYGGIGVDPKSGWLTADAIQLMKALTMDFPLQLTAATSSMEMNTPMMR